MTSHRPWFKSWPEGVPRSLEPYPDISLYAMFEETVSKFPDRPATAFFGKRLTYRQLAAQVRDAAAMLAGLGVKKGDRV
ncbi:MAG TPA: AMP-binding protein, partial [Actinomycetota bacterium]